jgi:hypothetical protein
MRLLGEVILSPFLSFVSPAFMVEFSGRTAGCRKGRNGGEITFPSICQILADQ